MDIKNTITKKEQTVNQFSLLIQKRFLPYFLTQFLGAFNDNFFKNALIILIAFGGNLVAENQVNVMTNLSAGLFILPFFLFSAVAGQIVDKVEKSQCMRWIKFFEILIMLFAALAFYFNAIYLLVAVLFIMGAQSTFFGPVKYSYIPQHLNENELIAGNALVQTGTFVAILAGTIVGGIVVALSTGTLLLSSLLVLVAILGFVSSLYIPKSPSLVPDLIVRWNPVVETWATIRLIFKDKSVGIAVLGISWFWFFGAMYIVQLPNYTKIILNGNEQVVTLLLTVFMMSVGSGALLCNWFSKGGIELALVPLGAIGLTVFGVDLFFAPVTASNINMQGELIGAYAFIMQGDNLRVIVDIMFIGMFAGLYIVPLFARVQQKSKAAYLSRVIAGNNILNALFMVVSASMAIILLSNGVSIAQLLLITTLLNFVVATFIFSVEPAYIVRFYTWIKGG